MTQPALDPLSDLFTRLEEIERDVLKGTFPASYVVTDEWPYEQSTFPYIVNRWLPSQADDLSEDINVVNQRVGIRILVSPATDANKAGRMRLMYRSAYRLGAYLRKYTRLTTPSQSSSPNWLSPEGITLEGWRGSEMFALGGVQTPQTGVELTLVVPMFMYGL